MPIYASRFPKIHLLISYRDDAEGKLGRLWQQVTQSATGGLPRYYLEPLTLDGAREVFETTFERLCMGYLPPTLITNTILPELEAESRQQTGENIYPPYLQIVGDKLSEIANASSESIVTQEAYSQVGGAKEIIGDYLLRSLEELGDKRESGKKVLIALTRLAGVKGSQTFSQLQYECSIEPEILQSLLRDMINLRMIRTIGENSYEIAHDYLASLVREKLFDERENEFKAIRELLASKARSYSRTHVLLHQEEMKVLYVYRERVMPNDDELRLLFCSCMLNKGPAWYWLKNRDISLLLRELLRDRNPRSRQAAAEAIRRFGRDRDTEILNELLRDENTDVRQAAAAAFAKLAHPQDIPTLRELLEDQSSYIRRIAAEAIGKLGCQDDITILKELLKDKDDNVCNEAISAIINIAEREGILKELLNDREVDVRKAAAEAIGERGNREDILLLGRLLSDTNLYVRGAAAEAIGILGTNENIPILEVLLRDEELHVRQSTKAICKLASHNNIQMLKELLENNDEEIRKAAAEAICKLATPEDIPMLRELLSYACYDVCIILAGIVGKLGSHSDIPTLKGLMRGEYPRRESSQFPTGEQEHLDIIMNEIYEILAPEWKFAAAEAAVMIVSQKNIRILKEAFMNRRGRRPSRTVLARVIIELASHEDIEALEELLEYGYWEAAEKIVELASPQEIIKMKSLLKSNSHIRQVVVETIGRYGNDEDIPILKDLLKDGYSSVRLSAAEAICKLAGQGCLESILADASELPVDVLATLDEHLYCPLNP